MTKPGISVVIPTHNRAGECLVAIDSALRQTLAPMEVIVVNDHSTPEDRSRLEEGCSADGRVNLISNQGNGSRGPAAARNLGVRSSRGDCIAFLDDDDAWLPEKLERQVPWLGAGYDLVCSNAVKSSGPNYFGSNANHEIKRDEILVHNPVVFSSVLVNRDLVSEGQGFRETEWLRGIEDYDLLLRLSDRGTRMLRLGEPLLRYCDSGAARLSSEKSRVAAALARMAAGRSLRRPGDLRQHRATAGFAAAALARTT